MQPQLPSSPSGTNWITKIDPAWIQKLLACVGYAMTHPRGDGVTILTQDGGTLRARQSPASAPGSAGGGGDAAAGVLTVGPSGGYGAATWQPVADDLTPGGTAVPVVVLPLK
jgi:hypothetical protein